MAKQGESRVAAAAILIGILCEITAAARTKGAPGPAGRAASAGPLCPPAPESQPSRAGAPCAPAAPPARTSISPVWHPVVVVNSPAPRSSARGLRASPGAGRPGSEARGRDTPRPSVPPAPPLFSRLSSLLPPGRRLALVPTESEPGSAAVREGSPSFPLPGLPALGPRGEATLRPPLSLAPGAGRVGAPGRARERGRWSARLGLFARCRPRRVSCPWRLLGAIPVSLIETRLREGVEQGTRRARREGRGRGPEREGDPGREGAPEKLGRAAAGHRRAALLEDSYFEIGGCPLRGAGCKGQVSLPLAVNLQYSL